MLLLDHVSISVISMDAARPFYDAVMRALGADKVYERPDALERIQPDWLSRGRGELVPEQGAATRRSGATARSRNAVPAPRRRASASQTRLNSLLDYGARCTAAEDSHSYLSILESAAVEPDARRHWCFKAESRSQVRAFHAAGLQNGGTDEGAPGLRAHYHEHYYAAFLHDPSGNRVEAVCHRAEAEIGMPPPSNNNQE